MQSITIATTLIYTILAVHCEGLSTFSAWDAQLPGHCFEQVNIESESLTEAWQQLLREHYLRCILIDDTGHGGGSFEFQRVQASGREILDAMCDFYGLEWQQEPRTRVIFLYPQGKVLESLLWGRVEIDSNLEHIPMFTAALGVLFPQHTHPRHDALCLDRRFLDLHTLDRPVILPQGYYTAHEFIALCCASDPALTFYVVRDESVLCDYTLVPVNIPMRKTNSKPVGAVELFWQSEIGGTLNDANCGACVLAALSSEDPRRRQKARAYVEMNMFNFGLLSAIRKHASKSSEISDKIWVAFSFAEALGRRIYQSDLQVIGIPQTELKELRENIEILKPRGDHLELVLLSALEILRITRDRQEVEGHLSALSSIGSEWLSIVPELTQLCWYSPTVRETVEDLFSSGTLQRKVCPDTLYSAFSISLPVPGARQEEPNGPVRWSAPRLPAEPESFDDPSTHER